MTDVIVAGMRPQPKVGLKRTIAVLILICLGGYVSAQWLAGQKFLRGAFGFDGVASLLAFAALIVIYTAIGGFRIWHNTVTLWSPTRNVYLSGQSAKAVLEILFTTRLPWAAVPHAAI